MTFSFDISLGTDLDKVRFRIGDTDADDVLIENETITALLSGDFPGVLACSVACVKAIIAKLSRDAVDRTVVSMSVSRAQKIQHYRDLLEELQKELAATGGRVFASGISKSANRALDDDDDLIKPKLRTDFNRRVLESFDPTDDPFCDLPN